MKTLLVTVSLAVAGMSTVQAQVFRPSVGTGAVVGAVAGGLIGGHNGDRWAQGAVIGAAAGALIGAAMTPAEPTYAPPVYLTAAPVYGQQQVYSNTAPQVVYAPTTSIPDAPTVANAPVVVNAPAPQVVHAPPQVVYVQQEPQVVYVPAPTREVVYVRPPVVSFGFGIHSGPRYYPSYRSGHYSPPRWSSHRGHGDDRGRGHDRGHGHGHGRR